MFLLFNITSFLFCVSQFTLVYADCQIDPLRIKPAPLITTKNLQIIYPDSSAHLARLESKVQIIIACPGSELTHQGIPIGQSIEATCENGQIFTFQDHNLDFYSLKCQIIPKATVRYTHKKCAEGGDEIEIGYDLLPISGQFLRQIKICFDSVSLSPLYSHSNLTGSIGYRDGGVPRVFFEENGFYPTSQNLDTLYRRDFERSTINRLLNLPNNSFDLIRPNGELFINRGHLSAKGDFVYAFQQLATFRYVNAAPQWASFNGGNWNEVEISVRDYADYHRTNLQVFTGVHGVSSLTDQRSGERTPLYLHTIDGRNLIPVPQLFWKLVYDARSGAGVVLVGVNNAYEFDQARDVICNDVSDRIPWLNNKLKRQKRNIELGYVYACSVEDFSGAVNVSPRINAKNLLT